MAREQPVGEAEQRARPEPCAGAAVFDLHAREPAAHVDHDPVGLRLPVEARAAAAEVDREVVLLCVGDRLADILGVVRDHDDGRQQAIGARVGGVCDEVDRAVQHALGAKQRGQACAQRWCGSGGERIGRAVGEGGTGRTADAPRVGGEQRRARRQASAIPGATSICTSRGPSLPSASPSAPCSSSRPPTLTPGTP